MSVSFNIFATDASNFERNAFNTFRQQYAQNELYRSYCHAINRQVDDVTKVSDIPFLPISFFKSHRIQTGTFEPAVVFESSGTTGSINSRHYVSDLHRYESSFSKGFELFYGKPGQYCIIGLLPSYLERKNSSLVYMVNKLITASGHQHSGFYLDDFDKLHLVITDNENKQQKTLLIGVSFALLDFAEKYKMQLEHSIVMETGGMKGRRRDISREALHDALRNGFGVHSIHSEYGMTELLSQAYSKGSGVFLPVPWMRILLRPEDDPLGLHTTQKVQTGAINIIDLANLDSCSFIATDDVGRLYPDGSFEVLGRLENSDTRGCGLMIM